MTGFVEAGFWGLVGGSALVVGALLGCFASLPPRLVAAVMAIGSGVLISAVAFDLMDEAFRQGGVAASGLGLLAGAAAYTLANVLLARSGARHRKRSGHVDGARQPDADAHPGLAIAIGSLLDGIPESVVIGMSLLDKGVAPAIIVAVFLSNVPEALASSTGMKRAGRRPGYIFGVWGTIALASGAAAILGYAAFADADPRLVAAVTAVAAGAILAMLVDTMIPEATGESHDFSGLFAAAGFFTAFILSKLG